MNIPELTKDHALLAEMIALADSHGQALSPTDLLVMGKIAGIAQGHALEEKIPEAVENVEKLTTHYIRRDGEIHVPPLNASAVRGLCRRELSALHTDAMKSWIAEDHRGDSSRAARQAKILEARNLTNRATMMEIALRAYHLEGRVLRQQHAATEMFLRSIETEEMLTERSVLISASGSFKQYAPPSPKNMEQLPFEAFELYTTLWPVIKTHLERGDTQKILQYLPLFKMLAKSKEPTQKAFAEFILLHSESVETCNEMQKQRDARGLDILIELQQAFSDTTLLKIARVTAPALVTLSHSFALETKRCLKSEGLSYDWIPFFTRTRETLAMLREEGYLIAQADRMAATIEKLEQLIATENKTKSAPLFGEYEKRKSAYNPERIRSISLKPLPPFDLVKHIEMGPGTASRHLAIEAAPQVAPKKKKKKKKKKAKAEEAIERPKTPESVPSEPEAVEVLRKLSEAERVVLKMNDAPFLNTHPRVTRWQKVKSPSDVLGLTGYEAHEDPATTWLYHGFTPLVDKLITSDELRAKYAYKTERGFGLVTQIEREGVYERGIIYYGINDEGHCFHRMFHPCNLNKFLAQDILTIAQEVENSVHDQGVDEMDSGKEPEDQFIGDTWELRERFGSITFTDDKHKAKIHICRLPEGGI